jgi:hypothetical protein
MNMNLVKAVLSESNVIWFQIAAFLAFLLLFLGVVFWVFLPGAKDYYEKIAIDAVKGE